METLEEQMLKAQVAAEPGSMKDLGKSDVGAVTLKELSSAGWVYVWDNKTGERSIVNRNMLLDQLKKKRKDGTTVFTTVKPNFEPYRGTLKCWLHADDPNRQHYDEIGLAVCKKANLTSPYQVERHMQKRHPAEFATIKAEKEKKEKDEDRAFQKLMLASLTKQQESKVEMKEEPPFSDPPEAPLYVSDKPKRKRK